VFLVLVLFVLALTWGTQTCLYHLNRFLDPPQPIRAIEFERLDDEHLLCNLLGVDLVLAVPYSPWPRWTTLAAPWFDQTEWR
jgi:hypothetical protein